MDNLARETILARSAGMSYGKWKAMQTPTKIEPKVDPNIKKCLNCGNEIIQRGNRERIYCDAFCGNQYRDRLYKERNRRENADG